MFRLVTPQTDEQLANYYHFRWRMLREPWQMPKGSERDAYDDLSEHRMIINNRDQVVAIGRLYLTPDNEGQVRFMAVDPEVRHHGLGGLILMALESLARQDGAKRMVCNAREDAIPFYLKNGFASEGELSDERGPVRHQQMLKHLEPLNEVVRHPDWCHELQTLWQQQIPISDKMGIKINQYTGYRFEVSALFNANLNPNEFMFAGSIFTMATLAGWGFIWLLLKERGLEGNIILVDSHIRYSSPVTERPKAVSTVENLRGDIDRLAKGRKGRISVDVNVYSGNNVASCFTGTYLILPLHVENEFTSL
ncbi:bifunctional GNAT family N-acetyltransferase/hotdog fold thioesterase [Photobacterium lucens]|uniref:bifunctional GNAT family N-acetyltransferase/hotdog fold thioesterase n=1 Tax=Photobacterium lucens TaxID=2562949 RepID=UPI000D153AAC|nr:bifunctional GNAT family N-acetyltransferase/hotdog fold thioesterase [Photobacterium lucens]MBP2700868.1 GNAT family N-acetyltransferase [Vibrio parahaemolyticus]MZG56017.1 GNAT family N-acetyltransferase [Photobacterium lucens]MZG79597.1 GNAT family N-acetyltransferase [Photobacterium lucens]PSV19088.1 GNAT family N-acetyltransferase [Photobacterium leiognathi subsp. mandapamensis]